MTLTIASVYAVVLIYFSFMFYIDKRAVTADSTDLGHFLTKDETSSEHANTTHYKNPATGEVRADARVSGPGRASLEVELGHEFPANQRFWTHYKVEMEYAYRTRLDVSGEQAEAKALVQVVLGPNVSTVIEEEQTEVGSMESAANGEFITGKKKFLFKMKVYKTCTPMLKLTVQASSQSEAQAEANARAEIVANITSLSCQPHFI